MDIEENPLSGARVSDDDSFGGFEDDEEPRGTSPPNFGGSGTSDSSLISLSTEGQSDDNPLSENKGRKLGLINRPPGAPKDWGIDVTSLRARRRQASYRVKVAARYNKGHNVQVF